MNYSSVVNEDNEGRIYRCEVDVGECSSEVWDLIVMKWLDNRRDCTYFKMCL